jgi:hypothetical protein
MVSPRTISDTPAISDSSKNDIKKSSAKLQAKRAKALKDSMSAAKRKLEERSKQLADEREKERLDYEERMIKKNQFIRTPLPTGIGFFSEHMMKPLNAKKEEVVVEPEPVLPEPTMSPEEAAAFEALKEQEKKQLRAIALTDSIAAAKARYDSTPKGKLALAKAQRIAAKKAAKLVRTTSSGDCSSEADDVVRELAPEEHARIAEEASYASVDAAFARSKEVEASALMESIAASIEYSEGYVIHIKDLIAAMELEDEDDIDALDQLLEEASEHLKSIHDFYAKARETLDEISMAAADAEVLSSQIPSSLTVDDAVHFNESTSTSAEKAHLKTMELRKIVDDLAIAVDSIKAVDKDVENFAIEEEDDDGDEDADEENEEDIEGEFENEIKHDDDEVDQPAILSENENSADQPVVEESSVIDEPVLEDSEDVACSAVDSPVTASENSPALEISSYDEAEEYDANQSEY